MATDERPKVTADKSKKRKQRYLPQNKPVKKKGAYPLRPGVQGFFLTCDGGRERQAAHEALNVIDSFFEELVHGKDSGVKPGGLPERPLNKKITFSYSSDEDNDNDTDQDVDEEAEGGDENGAKNVPANGKGNNSEKSANEKEQTLKSCQGQQTIENASGNEEVTGNDDRQINDADEPPAKKPCLERNASETVCKDKVEEKSIDKLIEAELEELGDKNKRRFMKLDSGCNGLAFIQMRKLDGDPSPKDIVQHIMTSAAKTRKHMSRFILRFLPVEVACYASEDEISKAIKPLVERYFPVETNNPQKFAVVYKARANTGIDRTKIIDTVARSVPAPHKVDLSNPEKTIVVEIVKTICLIGVVEQYKEFAKYNLRELTSSTK